MRTTKPTLRPLLASLQTCLWAVLALCLGNAWGMRTVDPLDLPKAERQILSESAEDQRVQFNARWYDAERGSFTGRDIAEQFWTPYSYVGNSPLTGTDPTGLFDDTYKGNLDIKTSGSNISIVEGSYYDKSLALPDIHLAPMANSEFTNYQKLQSMATGHYMKYLMWPDAVGLSASGEFTVGAGAQLGFSFMWFPHDEINTGMNAYFDAKPTFGLNLGISLTAVGASQGSRTGPIEKDYPGGWGWNAGLGLLSVGSNYSQTFNSTGGGAGVGGAFKLGASFYPASASLLLRSGK